MIRFFKSLMTTRQAMAEAARLLAEWKEEGIHESRNVKAVNEWMAKHDTTTRPLTAREKLDREFVNLKV
jgi:hypothetical protein